MADVWTNSFKIKVQEMRGFLECANSISMSASAECLRLLQDLLKMAVMVFTQSSYRFGGIQLISKSDEPNTWLSTYLDSDFELSDVGNFSALKEARVLIKSLSEEFQCIKEEMQYDDSEEETLENIEFVETANDQSALSTLKTVQRKLLMTSYKCFFCEDSTEFNSERDLAMHVQVSHMKRQKNGHVLHCLHCKKIYSFSRKFFTESAVSEMLVFVFQHLVNDHGSLFSSPDFILPVLCPLECGVVRYSINSVRKHLVQVHKRTLSDNEAVDTFSPLLALVKAPRCVSVKRKLTARHPRKKKTKLDSEDSGDGYHCPFSPNVTPRTSLSVINDYAINMSRHCCFLCEDQVFDSQDALRTHWSSEHFSSTIPHRHIQCPFCDARYKVQSAKSSRFQIAQVMSYLCFHLCTAHADVYTLPEYVHRVECPFPGCTALHFQLHTLRQHLPAHDIYSNIQQLRSGAFMVWYDPNTQAKFSRYVCFMCSDEEIEYASIIDYMEHWYTQHIALEAPFAVSTCPQCGDVFSVQIKKSGLKEASRILQLISKVLAHMVACHIEVPRYVECLPDAKLCQENVDQSHAIIPVTPGTLVDTDLPKPMNRKMSLNMYGGFHERSLTLTENRCFVCGIQSALFSSDAELMEHWMANHSRDTASGKSLLCPLCSHSYRLQKLVPSTFFETLGFYCLHLTRNHGVALPSFVVNFPCPVVHCNFVAFSLHALQRHVYTHGVEAITLEDITQGEIPLPSLPTVADFRAFRCYLCTEDNTEYETALFFVNHWLQTHFELTRQTSKYTCCLSCPYCDHTEKGVLKKLLLPVLLEKISALLSHLISRHGIPIPDYVKEVACVEDGCGHVDVSASSLDRHNSLTHAERGLTSVQPSSGLTSVQPSNSCSLHYTEYKCFECDDAVSGYASVQDLSDHWVAEHMETSDSLLVLQCPHCNKQLTHKYFSAHPHPPNVQATVARYLTHLVKQHQRPVPAYILEYKCDHYGCDFFTFIPKRLTAHKKAYHDPKQEDGDPQPTNKIVKDDFRPKDLMLSRFSCFLCETDAEDFGCKTALVSHVSSSHFHETAKGPVIKCPHCYKQFKMSTKHSIRKIFESLGALLTHMVEKHLFEAPDYVSRFPCTQDSCSFSTFTADHLATHYKINHGIINEELSLQKPKTFFSTNKSCQNLTSKLIMKMKRYICFLCPEAREYHTIVEYAQHWRELHLIHSEDVFLLKCMHCDTKYRIPFKKGMECSGVFERASNLLMHLVSKHNMLAPDYIVPYRCEAVNCEYVTYTLLKLETHCKTFHNVTHAALAENAERIRESANDSTWLTLNLCDQTAMPPVEASFMCFKCGAEFTSLALKEQHISENHDSVSQFLCHVCSRSFRAIESYHMHLFKEHGIESEDHKGLYCDLCEFSTVLPNKLASHLYKVHAIVNTSIV